MEQLAQERLGNARLGACISYGNVSLFPLYGEEQPHLGYLTLQESMDQGLLEVTEVEAQGRVPELCVTNKAERPILLVDGEELIGAKQNRVLNTTVLVAAGGEIIIPVSCTEQGRWSYVSHEFYESGHMMVRNMRALNRRAVAASNCCVFCRSACQIRLRSRSRICRCRSSSGRR